jgi:hypothetical protein
MDKKLKILFFTGISFAASIALMVPWFENHMRYEEYGKTEENSYKDRFGTNPSALNEKKLAEVGEVGEKNLAMTMCLNRYRKENHSFAPALTACKQELLYDLAR